MQFILKLVLVSMCTTLFCQNGSTAAAGLTRLDELEEIEAIGLLSYGDLAKRVLRLENKLEEQKVKLDSMSGTVQNPESIRAASLSNEENDVPAFSVARMDDLVDLVGTMQDVSFDLIITQSNNFDMDTGIYTSPAPGYYFFTITAHTYHSTPLLLALQKNNDFVAMIETDAELSGRQIMQSQSVVLELGLGDEVKLVLGPYSALSGHPVYPYTIFSGFLVQSI